MNNTNIISKKNLIPFILVTSLFGLWGFANAVTDPMVQAFKKVLELSNSQAAWVQMAFYGGYFSMAIPAAIFIKKYSYKTAILIGLALYSTGALIFYPAAITELFWFFCLGLYILTFGLAFLETAANPYILAMGSHHNATQRLNLAQSFNPIGSIIGLLVAQSFVLKKLQSDNIENFSDLDMATKMAIRSSDLLVIKNPYVVLGLVLMLIFMVILFSKMPKYKDESHRVNIKDSLNILIHNKRYLLGVLAQVLYVGSQIMCWTYIYQYGEAIGIKSQDSANYQFYAFIGFLLGRLICTFLLKFYNSAKLLGIFACFGLLFTLLAISLEGIYGMYSLVSISFFMSLMFPTIYGIALGGLNGEDAKIGSAGLVMAIVGGALMPLLQGKIIDIGGSKVNDIRILGVTEVNFSFILSAICFSYIIWYGFMVYFKYEKN